MASPASHEGMEAKPESAWRAPRRLASLGVLVVVLIFPEVAAAGGWATSIELESGHAAPGERMEAGTEFLFRSIEAAEAARRTGTHYAYLLAGFDFDIVERVVDEPQPRRWWTLGGAKAIPVGRVRLSGWDANFARARVSFVVPGVETGSYALMFCDLGCAHPLGDIVPARMTVAGDPVQARLLGRLDRLEARVARQARIAHAAQREARNEEERTAAEPEEALEARVRHLERGLGRREAPELPWAAFAGWFFAGVAMGVLGVRLMRRRRHPPVLGGELDGEVEEPRELVGSIPT